MVPRSKNLWLVVRKMMITQVDLDKFEIQSEKKGKKLIWGKKCGSECEAERELVGEEHDVFAAEDE